MNVTAEKVVLINYTVVDSDGNLIDSSEGGEPLAYLHGFSNIIPGLEKALEGMKAGDAFNVDISPADAYGEYRAEMVQSVPRSAFHGIDTIEPGMVFHAQGPQGPVEVTVTAVEADTITIDGNHPLAGKALNFKGAVIEVRDASAEEIEHGHAHHGDHHHH